MPIDSILEELKAKYGISKVELERIVDTQFKVAYDAIEAKTIKSIKFANLGKIRPSTFLINNYEKFSKES